MTRRSNTLAVILHYGPVDDTVACVRAIRASQGRQIDILIVENSATSATRELLPDVESILTGGNIGFAAGNNFGLRLALERDYEFSFLINNDLFVHPRMFDLLLSVAEADPSVGLIGPATYYFDRPEVLWAAGGKIQRSKARVGGTKTSPPPGTPAVQETDYLPGSAVLIRNSAMQRAGLLPEDYFLGYEEAEFAVNFTRAGYRVLVSHEAQALHKVGMSSQRLPKYIYNEFRNRFLFAGCLHGPLLGKLMSLAIWQSQRFAGGDMFRLATLAHHHHRRSRKIEVNHLDEIARLFPAVSA